VSPELRRREVVDDDGWGRDRAGRSAPEISVSGQRIIKPISKPGKNLQRRCNVPSSHLCTADPIARAALNQIISFDNDYTAMSKRPGFDRDNITSVCEKSSMTASAFISLSFPISPLGLLSLNRKHLSFDMESIEVTASEPSDKDALDLITKAEAVAEMAQTSNEEDIGEIPSISEGKTAYSKLSVTLMVVFSGLAIGSDGFNASIIGNLSLIFGVLYPDLSTTMYSRLSNAFIIGMIVGMLGFGYISDRLGRKSGAVLTTLILVVGIALSAASSGKDELGMFWMLVISRGIAGVGAGG
jgi:hypothetical protein